MTDAWLRKIERPATGRLEIWDTKAAGLVLRITSAGTATWSVRTRTRDGKRTRPKIGTYPAMGVAAARKQALAKLAAIQAGGDPVAADRAARAAREARAVLPTVAERMAEWQTARSAKWSVRYATEVARIVKKDVSPKLGNRPLSETTRADWAGLAADKRKKRSARRKDHQPATAMASLLYRVCSAFLGHAEAHGWINTPMLPRKGLVTIAPPPKPRARVLTDAEIYAVWAASAALNPKPRAFVRMLILTAARELEVADIATGEIDRDSRRWTIPATRAKNGIAITLPLPELATVELWPLWPVNPERAGPGRRLLGDIVGNGLRGFSKLKAKVDKESGVTGWRWHDLRRTARTGMAKLGVPSDHAEAAINHISDRSGLLRTYDLHDYAPEVIEALSKWQAHVAKVVSNIPASAE
jgi:integrase